MGLFHRDNQWRFAGLFGVTAIILISATTIIAGCGLPQYNVLAPPTAVTGTLPAQLEFQTPLLDTGIQGYIVYYKVYRNNEVSGLYLDERSQFDPSYYVDTTQELEPGARLPLRLEFVRAGRAGSSTYGSWLIPHPGAGVVVNIDFDPSGDGVYNRSSNPPEVDNTSDPVFVMARGTIDPTVVGVFAGVNPGDFRSFVGGDWEADFGVEANDEPDDYYDGDLLRPPPLNPVTPIGLSGLPIVGVDSGGYDFATTTSFTIGFCVYSTGFDPNDLTKLESVPLHIGGVNYVIEEDSPADRRNRQGL